MNDSELYEAIQEYLQTTDEAFVARLDDFVRQAEQEIYRRTQLPELRTMDTSTYVTTGSTESVSLHADTIEVFSISVSGQRNLIRVDESFIREAYPDTSQEGLPYHYATVGRASLILGPVPDQAYTLIVHYSKFPESIVTAGQTWLGDNAEEALLAGAIFKAYSFLKGEPDLLKQYRETFDGQIALLTPEGSDTPQDTSLGT